MRVSKNPYRKMPEWIAWQNMVYRCNAPRQSRIYIYDKGIRVHESWLGERGFLNFLKCVGKRPEGFTLGRIDRTGNYAPGNVRWMSYSEFNKLRPTPFVRRNPTHGHYTGGYAVQHATLPQYDFARQAFTQ